MCLTLELSEFFIFVVCGVMMTCTKLFILRMTMSLYLFPELVSEVFRALVRTLCLSTAPSATIRPFMPLRGGTTPSGALWGMKATLEVDITAAPPSLRSSRLRTSEFRPARNY